MPRYILAIFFFCIVGICIWKRRKLKVLIGVVNKSPDDCAREDGVDVDVESLARVGQSEESSSLGRQCVMWACKNQARKRGLTITALVTNAKHKVKHVDDNGNVIYGPESITPEYDGLYTRDLVGKVCSTYQAPTIETLQLAQSVYDGNVEDPTNGATKWDSPGLLDDPDALASKREQEGFHLVLVPGVNKTRFWE